MIHRLSESIAYFYGKKAHYSKDKIEVCIYGLELIISDVIVMIIAILMSVITKTFIYTVLLLLVFVLLRHQAGGFHASSHFRCNALFFAAYIVSLLLIKLIPVTLMKYIAIIMSVISLVEIFLYAPAEHPNRPVSKKKKKKFRVRSIVMTTVFAILVIILSIHEITSIYGLGIALGIFFVGLSIMAETIKKSVNTAE